MIVWGELFRSIYKRIVKRIALPLGILVIAAIAIPIAIQHLTPEAAHPVETLSLMDIYPLLVRFPCTDEAHMNVYRMFTEQDWIPDTPWQTGPPFEPDDLCGISFWPPGHGPITLTD